MWKLLINLCLGLAALVELYVHAINTPGVIPNVQNAWDSFVEAKCSATIKDAMDVYEVAMMSQLKDELPCDNDQLRRSHEMALKNSESHFMADTAGISTNTIEKYLKKLKVRHKTNKTRLKCHFEESANRYSDKDLSRNSLDDGIEIKQKT